MNFDFLVLGATGLQGKIVCKDLFKNNYSVLMCGRDRSRIKHLLNKYKTSFEYIDVKNIDQTAKVIKKSGADVVINCVEGDWNLNILKACIKANVNSIDLGSEVWMTKKQFSLDSALKRKNITHITGAGSVPGIGNVMLRYASPKFDSFDTIDVGFDWKSNMEYFVVPFSIQSIIEEFTEPASIVKNKKFINIKPMSTLTYCYPRAIGRQKCFNERHPEYYTFLHYYKNKGLKNVRCFAGFPKHSFDKIKTLIELGLGSKKEINIKGTKIKPIDFLTEVLKNIKIPKEYKEKENLWVHIHGKKGGKNKFIKMECVVKTLKGWEEDYTNIDTGMPASIIAQMVTIKANS